MSGGQRSTVAHLIQGLRGEKDADKISAAAAAPQLKIQSAAGRRVVVTPVGGPVQVQQSADGSQIRIMADEEKHEIARSVRSSGNRLLCNRLLDRGPDLRQQVGGAHTCLQRFAVFVIEGRRMQGDEGAKFRL